jgi:small Trp-rich protein
MLFLFVGVIGVLLKYLEIGPVATLEWWIVFVPFGMAVLWWWWADASGYTKKKEMEKMEKRRQHRIDKQRDAMGMLKKRK